MLIGVLAGEELCNGHGRGQNCRRSCGSLASAGTALWLLSLALSQLMPLNKQIYTPSFALWSAGLLLLLFAALLYLLDVRFVRRGWSLALIFGTNAVFAFCLSRVITDMLTLVRVNTDTGRRALHQALNMWIFASWLPPRAASLAYAVTLVLF